MVEDVAAHPVVEGPRSGKRVRYLEIADTTDGVYARFEMWLAPPTGSHGPMRHVHPEQDEYLEVRDDVRLLASIGRLRGYTADRPEYVPADRRHNLGR